MKKSGFTTEEQLVQAILASVRRARRREYRGDLEVDAGVGVADLVLTKRTNRSTDALRALGTISPRLAILLNQDIGGVIRTRADLAKCLGTSESAAQRVISQLVTARLATHSRGSVQISTVNRLPFDRLIAVEAKLKDWQRVLIQAYRNLQFADESWAVIDHAYIRPTLAHIDRFCNAGVGLASIDRERGLFIHHTASTRNPMSLTKHWQAQAVLAARALMRTHTSEAR